MSITANGGDLERTRTHALTASVRVAATTLAGHPFAWRAEGTSPNGDIHEALSRAAAGFAPRPEIAEYLLEHEANMIGRLASGETWLTFEVGAYHCTIDNGHDDGTVVRWEVPSSGTESIISARAPRRSNPFSLRGFAELIGLSISPVKFLGSNQGGAETHVYVPEPWELDQVAFVTREHERS